MIELVLNGEKSTVPVSADSSLKELIELLQKKFDQRNLLISSIRLDGEDLTPERESEVESFPLEDFSTLEFTVAPTSEVVGETLQTLMNFTRQMIFLARRIELEKEPLPREEGMLRLSDWIETFDKTVRQIKRVLRIGLSPKIDLLQADMTELLRDVLVARERGDHEEAARIVGTELAENLDLWYRTGIPSLMDRAEL